MVEVVRTKAEALANPAPGDRWQVRGDGGLRVNSRKVLGICSFGVEVEDHRTGGIFRMTPSLPGFRRWASGAEYMGEQV